MKSPIVRDDYHAGKWMINTNVKMPSGEWVHLKQRGYAKRKDAEEDLAKQKSLIRQRMGFKALDGSFEALADSFLEHMRERRKPTTFHDMERDMRNYIVSPLQGKSTDEVFSGDCLERWRVGFLRRTSDIGQKRINWILHHLEILSKFAFEKGLIGEGGLRLSMVAGERVRERLHPKTNYTVWTVEQYKQFIATFDEKDRMLVLFQWLFFSGCRIGEALALQWQDVDFAQNAVSICKSCSSGVGTGRTEIFTTKTAAGVRTVYCSSDMIAQLSKLQYAYEGMPKDYVFFGAAPIGRMTVRRSLDEHTKAAGLPYLKIHEIRHTTNTWLLSGERSTDELKAITERLGRSSLKVTMDVYFHAKKDSAKKLADEIKIK